ncbi:hypothetical protein V8E53_008710 [Lactarius tabidus]
MSFENNVPRTRTPGSMVALFSEELSSWGGPLGISQQQGSLPQHATGLSVPAPPPIRPAIQSPAPIPVATQAATLQPKFQSAPEDPGLSSASLGKGATWTGLSMSKSRTQPPDVTTISYPAWRRQINTHDDIAMSAIQTSLAVLTGRSSLATQLPSIAPIGVLLLEVLTMRDEVKQYKEECEIVMHNIGRIAMIIVNIGELCEKHNLSEEDLPASLLAILYSLQRELDRIKQVLEQCSKRRGIKGFLLRQDTLTKIKQCDVELSNALQAFQLELALNAGAELIPIRREERSPPTLAQLRDQLFPRQLTPRIFCSFLFFFFFFSFFLFFFFLTNNISSSRRS